MTVSLKDVLAGDVRAAARLMRDLDDEIPAAHRVLKRLYKHTGRAYILAILGDRIRMQKHTLDEGVFIRSLATRGHMWGLSRSTIDIVNVMDAMGKDVVIIETVGVGQDEVEIVKVAHTNLVVVVPGLGDDIQAIKAGILEIADI